MQKETCLAPRTNVRSQMSGAAPVTMILNKPSIFVVNVKIHHSCRCLAGPSSIRVCFENLRFSRPRSGPCASCPVYTPSHLPASRAKLAEGPCLIVQRGRDSRNHRPYCLVSTRRSKIATTPRSDAVRINRPKP